MLGQSFPKKRQGEHELDRAPPIVNQSLLFGFEGIEGAMISREKLADGDFAERSAAEEDVVVPCGEVQQPGGARVELEQGLGSAQPRPSVYPTGPS